MYGELTTRMAMSIDGARDIGEVGLDAWVRLAAESGVSERFARRTTTRLVTRVKEESVLLAAEPEHQNEAAAQIAARVAALSL